MVEYSDKDAMGIFEMFIVDEYFVIMKKILLTFPEDTPCTLKVRTETDASPAEAVRRRQLLSQVSATEHAYVEQSVCKQWQAADVSVRAHLSIVPR